MRRFLFFLGCIETVFSVTWQPATAGSNNWNDANWDGTVPNATGATAAFGTTSGGVNEVVIQSASTKIGTLTFNNTDSTGSFLLSRSGSGSLQMDVSSGSNTLTVSATNVSDNVISSNITLSDSLTFTNSSSSSLTISGVISGGGTRNITYTGPGTWILASSSVNGYGTTTLNSGTLRMGNASILPNSGLTLSGGTLDLYGYSQSVSTLTFSSGTITSSTTDATLSFTTGGTIAGLISGPVALTKTGTGSTTLSNSSNSYTGGTTINNGATSGTIIASAAGALGTGTVTIGQNGALRGGNITLSNPITLASSGTPTVGTSGGTPFTLSGKISGSNALTIFNANTVILSNNTNNYTGGTTISTGTLQMGAANVIPSTGTVTLADTTVLELAGYDQSMGPISGSGTSSIIQSSSGTPTLTTNVSSDQTYDGTITDAITLVKAGSSKLTLTNTLNDYSGGSTISAGTLTAQATGALGSGTISIAADAILQGNGTFTLSNAASLSVGSYIDVTTGNILTMSGQISGVGGFTKTGTGTLIISYANTYEGDTATSAGTLQLGIANAIPSTSDVSLGTSTSLDLAGYAQTLTGALSGAGTLASSSGTPTLTLNPSTNSTFSGPLTNAISLVKGGTGTLTLSNAANSFTGNVTVNGGTLAVASGGALTAVNALAINSGGTFSNAGAVTASSVTVASGGTLVNTGTITSNVTNSGTLSTGSTIGTLTITGNCTQTATSDLYAQITSSAYDQFQISGNLTVNSGATLTIQVNQGYYAPGTQNQIVLVGGTISQQFTNNIIAPPLLLVTTTYSPSLLFLGEELGDAFNSRITVTINSTPVNQVITSGNAGQIAHCFTSPSIPNDADFQNVVANIQFLPNLTAIEDALDQLQPSALKGLTLSQEYAALFVRKSLSVRQNLLYFAKCSRTYFAKQPWNVWTRGGFETDKQSFTSTNVGYKNLIGLIQMGADKQLTSNIHFGIAGAYTHDTTTFYNQRGHGDSNSFYLNPYATFFTEGFVANLSAGGFYTLYDQTRHIEFGTDIDRNATSTPEGWGAQGHLDLGAIVSKNLWTVTPFAGLDVLWQYEQGFTETGADSIDLTLQSSQSLLYRMEAGSGVSRCVNYTSWNLIPSADVRYIREQRTLGRQYHSAFTVGSCASITNGLSPSRNLAGVGAQLTLEFVNPRLDATLRYAGEFGKGYVSNGLTASFGGSF